MAAYAVSAGTGRIVSAQTDVVWLPRSGVRGRRPVIILHGQLQLATDWNNDAAPNQQAVARAIAAAGLAMVSIYADGPSWGNDTSNTDIDTARTAMGSLYGCATDKVLLVGASMGAMAAWNYTRANPTRVAAIGNIMPTSDLDDLRDNNRAGTAQANINTAWGMPVGSTSSTDPLPARANPNTTTNAALIVSSGAPIKMYYSTADTVVIPSTVTSLATKLGVTPTVISSTHDHSDTLFGDVPLTELCQFLDANA